VAAVHTTLGFERDGGARLPGASEEHPTRGGLRIGKAHADGELAALHFLQAQPRTPRVSHPRACP
jgi:hypothetical protein